MSTGLNGLNVLVSILKLQNNLTKKFMVYNVCNILNRHIPRNIKPVLYFLHLRRKEAQELEQIGFFSYIVSFYLPL